MTVTVTVAVAVEPDATAEARALIAALDAELVARYTGDDFGAGSGEPDRAALNALHDLDAFVVARVDGTAVGCGALRRHDRRTAEVKRMYVDPAHRGQGVGGLVLAALEAEAARRGYRRLVLETGDKQPEAVTVYRRAGWHPIPNYGDYVTSAISRCFAKDLPDPALRIDPERLDHPDASPLLAAMHVEVEERYAGPSGDEGDVADPDEIADHGVDPDQVAAPVGAFLVARLDGAAVGCGAVRRRPSDPSGATGEVKRMYVDPAARGRGVARSLLAALEAEAARVGYRRLTLETGTAQHEAMALYESAGWSPIEPYGPYRRSALSRCYGKELGGSPSGSPDGG